MISHNSDYDSLVIERIAEYVSVNGFNLNQERKLQNSLKPTSWIEYTQTSIPISFFRYDKQLETILLQTSKDKLANYLSAAFAKVFGRRSCDYNVIVDKSL
jgi:hypothetical protein